MNTLFMIIFILNQAALFYFSTYTDAGNYFENPGDMARISNAYVATIRNSESSVNYFSGRDEDAADLFPDYRRLKLSEINQKSSYTEPDEIKITTRNHWPDFNIPYIRIAVGSEGVYRIRKNDFARVGISAEFIDPRTFGMYCRGKPYPVFVSGEIDGAFDEEDFIEFYGTSNFGTNYRAINKPDESYNEFMDIYSDTTVYWLCWNDESRVRVTAPEIPAELITDTLDYCTQVDHYERNNYPESPGGELTEQQMPFLQGNKTWIAGILYEGSALDNFTVKYLVPGTTAKFYYKVIGYALDTENNSHHSGVQINEHPEMLGEKIFEKFQQAILSSEFPSGFLKEGGNTIRLNLFPSASAANAIAIDWFDIEYARRLDLGEGFMKINFTEDHKSGTSAIKIMNALGEPAVVYKISPEWKRFSAVNVSGNRIVINDTVGKGDKYFAAAESEIRTPSLQPPVKIKNLLSGDYEAEHIIVTHPELMNEAEEYARFISENYGVVSKAFSVIDIYNQFGYGFISAQTVKDFLISAASVWKTHKPAYLLIIGDANYDFHNYKKIKNYSRNFVPSYGFPVSDTWFVVFDSAVCKPEMPVGRIPARKPEELKRFFEKHKQYLSGDYNIWNKTHLLISGGKSEAEQIFCKSVNDYLRTNLIRPAPAGGIVSQLFATSNPPTNFGPFEKSYSDSILSAGGLTISYVGHSGTNIWDNGIENTAQLKNIYGRSPLISDFGCSTAKFAEPDIDSFSEEFVTGVDGDAIAYLGNSSLGFLSVSNLFPSLFYGELLNSQTNCIGAAHIEAKKKLIVKHGLTLTNKIFIYCNSLIGDPITRLKIPPVPNLYIENAGAELVSSIDDNSDSAEVQINYVNLGKAAADSFNIVAGHYFGDTLISRHILRKILPLNFDTLLINLPVHDLSGRHYLEIKLDPENEIPEYCESDNEMKFEFEVPAADYLPLISHRTNTRQKGKIYFVPPLRSQYEKTFLLIDKSPEFKNPQRAEVMSDSIWAFVQLPELKIGTRYHAGFSRGMQNEKISEAFSFIYDTLRSAFSLCDSLSFASAALQNTEIAENSVVLSKTEVKMKISSGGNIPGGAAKLEIDGTEFAYNPQGCGFHLLLLDGKNYGYENYRWFNYWNEPSNLAAMTEYIKSVPAGKIFITAIGGECGGYGLPGNLISEYEKLGSTFIRKVKWGSSWIFIRGPGFIREAFSDSSAVNFDTSFTVKSRKGSILIKPLASACEWNSMEIKSGGEPRIKIKPLRNKSIPDTLTVIEYRNNPVDLRFLSEYKDDQIAFLIEMEKRSDEAETVITSVDMDFKIKPDLLPNKFPAVLQGDTLKPGEEIKLNFSIVNGGETTARNFNAAVNWERPDRTSETVFTFSADSLPPGGILNLNPALICRNYPGINRLNISIDPENKVSEFCEGNNYLSLSFLIEEDKSVPELKLTFDGEEIENGDFVAADPEIRIELSNMSFLPVTDTNAVTVFIDGSRISYTDNETKFYFHSKNPKLVVELNKIFDEGGHGIRVNAKNINSTSGHETILEKDFIVSENISPVHVYNYPNPFMDFTYFTFKLAVLPDELSINIYTVAGRLVKKIKPEANSLKYDFNRIYWDGKDEDGDAVANGIYIYKILLSKNGRSAGAIGKLAVVR